MMNTNNFAGVGLEIHEPLIFERNSPGSTGINFFYEDDTLGISDAELLTAIGKNLRSEEDPACLPEINEPDAVRHFTRLSKKNFSIDTSSYPLGSCTMKYNPKIHEWAARLPGITSLHPYMPVSELQEALKIYCELHDF